MNKNYIFLILGLIVVGVALALLMNISADTRDAEANECINKVAAEKEACFRNLALKYKDASLCAHLSTGSGEDAALNMCYLKVAQSILAESAETAKEACSLIDSASEEEGCYRSLQSMVSG